MYTLKPIELIPIARVLVDINFINNFYYLLKSASPIMYYVLPNWTVILITIFNK